MWQPGNMLLYFKGYFCRIREERAAKTGSSLASVTVRKIGAPARDVEDMIGGGASVMCFAGEYYTRKHLPFSSIIIPFDKVTTTNPTVQSLDTRILLQP